MVPGDFSKKPERDAYAFGNHNGESGAPESSVNTHVSTRTGAGCEDRAVHSGYREMRMRCTHMCK